MEVYIIIVAGGKGQRMDHQMPKQFHLLGGRPVVMRTFEAFSDFYGKAKFLLVLPGNEIGRWKHLRYEFGFEVPHEIVEGGPTRFHSVKNALALVPEKCLVFIHDAVRPLVDKTTIANCHRTAKIHGNAIPVVPSTESLRMVENGLSRAVNRENFKAVQTPQVFYSSLIKKAYAQTYNDQFTDDASVMEAMGTQLHIVEGHPDNIKITRPGDLGYAETVLATRNG
jgi:2-C-methyl-D-erythritol 4-phosphate cytidylyltransferase